MSTFRKFVDCSINFAFKPPIVSFIFQEINSDIVIELISWCHLQLFKCGYFLDFQHICVLISRMVPHFIHWSCQLKVLAWDKWFDESLCDISIGFISNRYSSQREIRCGTHFYFISICINYYNFICVLNITIEWKIYCQSTQIF